MVFGGGRNSLLNAGSDMSESTRMLEDSKGSQGSAEAEMHTSCSWLRILFPGLRT